ncbi:MAG: nuclear transport factor 2 family protein [Rhodospirillaceae bacterium]|nr:nuclear transport factor 2 family protein [Rhodospirillaceae bacterium]
MTRRSALKTGGVGAAAVTASSQIAMAETSDTAEFEEAFQTFVQTLATGDLDAFYATIHEDAVIIDEDIPFRLTKAGFKDHIDFHIGGMWEGFTWQDRNPNFRTFGDTGLVASFATFRGKPVDSGYRQRHMAFTQGWHNFDEGWRLINWHQSPFDGHILEASPG